jgi:signal transduction histidine kinase
MKAHEIEKNENMYKTEFLARASHELRTPLNAILGFAQVINLNKDNKLPKEHAMYFKHIEQSGWQLLSLVDDILDMTRICEGSITLNIEKVSLRNLIAKCFDALSLMAKKHDVNCSYKFEGVDLDKIEADNSRLCQIMNNLVTNAIKYNIPAGTVSVVVKETDTDTVRIEVQNTGAGIAGDELGMLFKPFSRVGEINKEDGRGIGLVLTKGLVECLNGRIGVESEPGVMTTFWFELPKKHIAASPTEHGENFRCSA